ncbi:unnamed protein product [Meloidogyne enterolobii]|uniref:Uncharacterized protein n=1 Tax=Meloidogyne enterolobii TaxID=390850 RepID=A0ACB0ZVB5_MELEN
MAFSKILLECVLPPSGRHESKADLLDSHEPINSVERVEHLQLAAKALQKESPLHCENDPIDLIILLNADTNQTSAEQFDDFKRAAKDTIRQAPPEQFQQRIRVTIWSGNPLQKQEPLTLDDALFAIDRIDWPTNDEISQIQRDSPQPLNNNFDCKSDLIFVIDTSQSVEEEFREQLDLVLELISRLPNKNFENGNIQIGAVSFHRNSLLHFSIGEIKEKNKIFEAISNIQHTGGSTSAVSGINLALEQIEKKRRSDARQIIVLVSGTFKSEFI